MSKIFSVVELETNTGISDSRLMGGIPDREDVEGSDLYQELVEDCGGSNISMSQSTPTATVRVKAKTPVTRIWNGSNHSRTL